MEVQNSEAIEELRNAAKLQGLAGIPKLLSSNIVPTIEINPRLTRVIDISRHLSLTSTGGVAMYTTPTNQDLYLTNVSLSWQCPAANDGVNGWIQYYHGGAIRFAILIAKQTLTAKDVHIEKVFPFPVKVDRGTAIAMSHTFTAGTSNMQGVIHGYLDESSNG